MSPDRIHEAVTRLLPQAQDFLSDLVRIPSMSGLEQEAMKFVEDRMSHLAVELERVPLSDAIRSDPDYSDPVPDLKYDGRFNLRLARRGSGGGRTLLLNTHTDVVPPSEGMADPWSGRYEDGVVYGRGACDAKGQVATIYLVLKVLDALGVRLGGDLIVHLVIEEENGGNGTLAMARRGERADGCVVMEPSDGRLYTSIRGAVWFRLVLTGRAGHSGQAGVTRSALLMARDAIGVLERYHADLLQRSRGFELFDGYPNPMPITFGRLNAGNWPASAPSVAVLEGVLGLLPNKTSRQVCEEMAQALRDCSDEYLAGHFDLHFMYRHDSSVLNPNHDLPTTVLEAARAAGQPLAVAGMTASCDAWMYNNQLGIPTVVWGPGTLKVAHSREEHIRMTEVASAAEVLVNTIVAWCGEQT